MLYYLKHQQINLQKWDDIIAKAVNSNVFGFYWFLNLATNNNWDAIIEDDYQTIMPLPFITKFRNKIIYNPKFIPFLGIFSKSLISEYKFKKFIKFASAHIKFFSLNFSKFTDFITDKNFINITPVKYYAKDLIYNYDTIHSNYSLYAQKAIFSAKQQQFYFNNQISIKGIINFLLEQNYFDNLSDIETLKNILLIAKDKHRFLIDAIYNKTSNLQGIAIYLTFKYTATLFIFQIAKSIKNTELRDIIKINLLNKFIQSSEKKNITLNIYPWLIKENFDFLDQLKFRQYKLSKVEFSSLPKFLTSLIKRRVS